MSQISSLFNEKPAVVCLCWIIDDTIIPKNCQKYGTDGDETKMSNSEHSFDEALSGKGGRRL